MARSLHPPAFCSEHGLFPAKAIAIAPGVEGTTFFDVGVICPRCGRNAEVIPGVYDASQTMLNVLVDKSISSEALAEIRRIAEELQSGGISIEQAKERAGKLSPKLVKLFDVTNWTDQAKATLYAAIIASVTAIVVAKIASSPSQNVIVQPVIERVVERKSDLMSSSALSNPAVPLPRPRPK